MVDLLWLIGSLLLSLRYRVRVTGAADVAARGTSGILFLPNHPALIDPVLVYAKLHRQFRPRCLGDKDRLALPILSWFAKRFGVILLPSPETYGPVSKAKVEEALETCAEVLRSGKNLLLYPAGRIQRSKLEDVGGNSAVATLLSRVPQARVVLIRSRGLWGSSFSRAFGRPPDLVRVAARGALRVLASFVLFAPRRRVTLELFEPADLPRGEGRAVLNRYLEAFYNQHPRSNLYVPYTPWERGGPRELPEPDSARPTGDPSLVSSVVREQVLAKLRELTGIADPLWPPPAETPGTVGVSSQVGDDPLSNCATPHGFDRDLARDLGMDSLARMELLSYIEREFGHPCTDPSSLQTIGDVVLAAAGMAAQGGSAVNPIPVRWFADTHLAPHVSDGSTITEVFLAQAARAPGRAALADQMSGVRTYRDIVLAILVLAPHLRRLPGEHLGIMLPASVGAAIAYLAVLFAGKTPVMINWTVGPRNIEHTLRVLDVQYVITATGLLSKLSDRGIRLDELRSHMLPLDELRKRITRMDKLLALLKSRLSWRSLRRAPLSDIAAILFTSGSENLPKAVPLTHANLLNNLRDITRAIEIRAEDKMIGFLPPFHSFGLTCTVLLPLCAGFRAVFHPNPTEGAALARVVAAYRTTLMVGTPTFLGGTVRAATDSELASLRLVVSGAEKCPDGLYEEIARRWPRMVILEGYGITECSPVVSVNREDSARRGTIGKPLASVESAVVDLERRVRVPPGEVGMLLVRGPSVFGGYLRYEGDTPFEMFEARLWYRTGDLVRQSPDGTLTFEGRLKRFVKRGGEMISLPAIEEALLAALRLLDQPTDQPADASGDSAGDGKHDGTTGTDALDSQVLLAVETASDSSPELVLFTVRNVTREQANAAIRAAGLSALHHVRLVRRVDAIPLLGTGKTDYRALRAMLANNARSTEAL